MKKILSILIIFCIFLFIYFLQSNFFTWFNLAGIKPNLFVILTLVLGLFAGRKVGISFGVILGLILDLIVGKKIGISGVMLGIVGFIGGYFDKNFSKESRITIILMVVGATAIFEIGSYIINIMLSSGVIEISNFIKVLLIEIFYNVILTIILYPIIQKYGYALENVFKNPQILTRYF